MVVLLMINQHFNITMTNQPSGTLKAPTLSNQNRKSLASWDQISMKNGYLASTQEDYDRAKIIHPTILPHSIWTAVL